MLKAKLLLACTLILLTPAAFGSSLRPLDPLEGVERATVDVRIGDPLRIDAPGADGLFGNERARGEKFIAQTKEKLQQMLTARKIRIDPKSEYGVIIGFYGGHSPIRDCEGKSVFLAEVSVWGPNRETGETEENDSHSLLGTAGPDELETQLMKAIDDFSESIRSFHHEEGD